MSAVIGGVDPDRAMKDALFAQVNAGRTTARYGGVLVPGGMAWLTFSVEPDVEQTAPANPVGVRPLEWVQDNGDETSFRAHTPFGVYSLWSSESGDWHIAIAPHSERMTRCSGKGSLEECQTICVQDYAKRAAAMF